MKVLAINGSARKDGNTAMLIRTVFEELDKEGIETELLQLSGEKIRGCIACYKCKENKDQRCAVDNDYINTCIEKMLDADGIILGSPTYFADVSSEIKALIDRAGMTSRMNEDMFKRKVGAAVIARRRGGAIHAFDTINHFFTIGQMITVGSNYWNFASGLAKGEVENDAEGIGTMRTLGQNMAWLLKKIE
ncbi:MAG TPA: flavodoxin family protein [Desulfobacterales bacterium]|nr:flavodoxin family protein [Desulfobacterales bacterium]HIP37928.1 flavodoxin family protein [Desulfocapsa sulfexigens]